MARPKKEENLPQQVSGSKAILGSILTEYKDHHLNQTQRVDWKISSGSLLLDVFLGGGIGPSLIRMCGQNNEGKTPQTLEILRQFLNNVPNSKGFWVVAEGRGLSEENRERCGLKFVSSPEEWEVGTVFVLESNIYEVFINAAKRLVKDNPEGVRYCFVVDSIDGLMLQADSEKEIDDDNMVAGTPKLSKKMLQSISLSMFKLGHLMILISQVTAAIKLDKYEKQPNRGGDFSGGNSLLHGADWIFEFQKTSKYDYIYNTSNGEYPKGGKAPPDLKSLGKIARVSLQKSALEASRYQIVEYPIKFGRKPSGIWLEKEMVDKLIFLTLLILKGSWLAWDDSLFAQLQLKFPDVEKQVQGAHNMVKYLEEHPDIRDFLYPKTLAFAKAMHIDE